MGERVNGVLYLDSIPGKTFSKQLVLDVSEWNFSTHVYDVCQQDVNTIKVVSRVSSEDAKELEKWFLSCVTSSSCVEGDYAKGTFCTFFNSGKTQCRIDIDMIYPFQFSQEDCNRHNDKETEDTLVKMELHCRDVTVVEHTVSPTPLCTTSFPLTEVFQVELHDSKTVDTVFELYKSVEDANTRISEIGENNITVKRLAVTKDAHAHDSHT